MLEFLRQVKVELGMVSWPSRQDTLKLTSTVILVSLVVGLYLGALDIAFTSVFSQLIK